MNCFSPLFSSRYRYASQLLLICVVFFLLSFTFATNFMKLLLFKEHFWLRKLKQIRRNRRLFVIRSFAGVFFFIQFVVVSFSGNVLVNVQLSSAQFNSFLIHFCAYAIRQLAALLFVGVLICFIHHNYWHFLHRLSVKVRLFFHCDVM